MESGGWFGVADLNKKKMILEMQRDCPSGYGQNTHRWISIDQQKYISVQTAKHEIKMFKHDNSQFIEDEAFRITLPNDGIINFVEFDREFKSIILINNHLTLQKRSMKNVNNITASIELKEKIKASNYRNLRLSDDGTTCALAAGWNKKYFYLIDIVNNHQYQMTSNMLRDSYAPCFINGESEYVAVGDRSGTIEIWDIANKTAIKCIDTRSNSMFRCSASTNNILAIGSADKTVKLYDIRNWECFYSHKYDIEPCSLHLTNDLQYITIGGDGGDLCVVLQIQ